MKLLSALKAGVHKLIFSQKYYFLDQRDNVCALLPYDLGIVTAKTPFGFSLAGYRTSQHHKGMQAGLFENEEVALFTKLLAKTDVFVDIGANIGYFTCLAGSKNKPIVAIEPQPKNLKLLYKNIAVNDIQNCEVFPIVLSDKTGILKLFGQSGTGASLIPNWAKQSARFPLTVPAHTFNNILGSRFSSERLLIKMDVEGAEYQVLEGAKDILNRSVKAVWVIEICLNEFHPDGTNVNFLNLFKMFWDRGYSAYMLSDLGHKLDEAEIQNWVKLGQSINKSYNYVFIPNDFNDGE